MSLELSPSEALHVASALRSQLAWYLEVPAYSIGREHVQDNIDRFVTAQLLARLDPEQFGAHEIQPGDTVERRRDSKVTGFVLGRGADRFSESVAVRYSDGSVGVAPVSDLRVTS